QPLHPGPGRHRKRDPGEPLYAPRVSVSALDELDRLRAQRADLLQEVQAQEAGLRYASIGVQQAREAVVAAERAAAAGGPQEGVVKAERALAKARQAQLEDASPERLQGKRAALRDL